MTSVTVAMSGGVDSAAAALLLLREGYSPHGVTFLMNEGDSAESAVTLAAALGIPHTATDATESFARLVTAPFARVYESGKTPNPCIICNRDVKFPLLLSAADANGSPLAATGHYARVRQVGDEYYIGVAADASKDQSYMLWTLAGDTVSRLLLPLGELTKAEVRELCRLEGLPCHSSPDSQDICFIPNKDHRAYLDRVLGPSSEGDLISSDGTVLGTHKGQRSFTVGQSRGLGIALGRRMYVTEKNAERNTVTLGDECELYKKTVRANNIRLRIPLEKETRLQVRVRYGKELSPATLYRSGEDEITAHLDSPVRAPAPGQSMVLYSDGLVVGGGFII